MPLGETVLNITIAGQAHIVLAGKRFEDFQMVVKTQKENMERLERQHESVVMRLGMFKRAISAGTNTTADEEDQDVHYAHKAREIQKRYQVEREKILKKFRLDRDTLLTRVNSYEAVGLGAFTIRCFSADKYCRIGRSRRWKPTR